MRNVASAASPGVRPIAFTTWAPGRAEAATCTSLVIAPATSALALPIWRPSKRMTTLSKGVKPLPVMVTFAVGGPTERERVITGAPSAAAVWASDMTSSAATIVQVARTWALGPAMDQPSSTIRTKRWSEPGTGAGFSTGTQDRTSGPRMNDALGAKRCQKTAPEITGSDVESRPRTGVSAGQAVQAAGVPGQDPLADRHRLGNGEVVAIDRVGEHSLERGAGHLRRDPQDLRLGRLVGRVEEL